MYRDTFISEFVWGATRGGRKGNENVTEWKILKQSNNIWV
jgi:hypothetical protein